MDRNCERTRVDVYTQHTQTLLIKTRVKGLDILIIQPNAKYLTRTIYTKVKNKVEKVLNCISRLKLQIFTLYCNLILKPQLCFIKKKKLITVLAIRALIYQLSQITT